MALHFRKSGALLLLTPKTGSTWLREKVRELGLDVEVVGDPALREHDQLSCFDRSRYPFIGAFVRNPVDWYQSYWAYRIERGWRPQYELDRHCASDSFEAFVRSAVTTLPGAVGNIYESYVGPASQPIDFVGRQEHLFEDFCRFLVAIGEADSAARLQAGDRINATRTRPDFTGELKELITLSEWHTMERFGYLDERPDPIDLKGMMARYPADKSDLRLLCLWTESIHWAPDDRKREAGRPVAAETRYARIHSNFALFAQHKRADPDYAEHQYRRALALDGNHPRTLCNYALFQWTQRNDVQEARRLMLKALSGRPQHPYTLGKFARLTDRALGDPQLAEVLYRQSLAGNAMQVEVVQELARLLERAGRHDDERVLLAAAAERMPDSEPLRVAHAMCLSRDADTAREAETILRALAERPEPSRIALLAYRSLLTRTGADPAAIAAWTARLDRTPQRERRDAVAGIVD
jgi:Flp pilus assembly protein TadD